MSATRGATLKDIPYPGVNQVETQIFQSEQKLTLILRKEKNLGATHQALLKLPETEETNQQLNELKIEIVSTVNQKILTEERLTALRQHLPEVLEEAKQNESDLNAKKEEIEKLKIEIRKIDTELTESLEKPMQLILSRKQLAENLERVGYQISTLISALHWHPQAAEGSPRLPEILEKFEKLVQNKRG